MRKGGNVINILFFIESLSGGGAEKVLRNLVNAMDQTKFCITVQTLYPDDAGKYLAPGIRYRYCYPAKNRINELRMRAEAAAGLTYPLHIKGDYDIEAAYLECGSTKIMASSTNQKALKLAWVHSDLQNWANPDDFAAATKKYYARYDFAVCVSENVLKNFEKLYGDTVPAVTVYNTIDDGEILRKSAEALPPDVSKRKLTIATVGRLSAPKHFIRALTAHKRMLEDGLDHDLWIIGEGEERSRLEAYIQENHLEVSAKLLGFRENPYNLMQAADILVCSSIFEGFSTFVTEGLIWENPSSPLTFLACRNCWVTANMGLSLRMMMKHSMKASSGCSQSRDFWSTTQNRLRFVAEISSARNWRRIRKRFLRENYGRNEESKWA